MDFPFFILEYSYEPSAPPLSLKSKIFYGRKSQCRGTIKFTVVQVLCGASLKRLLKTRVNHWGIQNVLLHLRRFAVIETKTAVLNIYYLKILTGFNTDPLMNLKMVITIKTKQDLQVYRFINI